MEHTAMEYLAKLVPVITAMLAAYAAFLTHFTSKDNARRDADIALLKKQTELFWRMVEQHMTTVLHSPHTPDRDKLLEKLQSGQPLADCELDELADDLEAVINNSNEMQGNRASAVFLLAALERYRQKVAEFREARQNDTSVLESGPHGNN